MQVSIALLRAFEAAARTGSFTDAASQLNLSSSAISHAIRKLETSLGVTLFERDNRKVRLSSDGVALLRHIAPAFDQIRRGIEFVSARGTKLLRLHSAPSFAAQWLTPRLSQFLALNPDIDLRLSASVNYTRFSTDEFDVDIVYGRPQIEGTVVLPLGEETVTPLCTPALANLIRRPEDLFDCPLIDSDNKLVRWPDWFAANGLSAPPTRGMRFDRSFLAIAAAAHGLGVALESTRLAEAEIATGRLVPVLAGQSIDVKYIGHHLVFPQTALVRQTLRTFTTWLTQELGVKMHDLR